MSKCNSTSINPSKQANGFHVRSNKHSFALKAAKIHNNKYNYDKVVYKTNKDKVVITCPIHGDFEQRPDKHITGRGCSNCGGTSKSNTKEFILKAQLVHDGKYDYSKVNYKTSRDKVVITCRKHGGFEQSPNHHLKGRRCPKCRSETTGFGRTEFIRACNRNNSGKGFLYVIYCHNNRESFYKIGVTSQDLSDRFHRKDFMPYDFDVSYLIEQNAEYIFNLESRIHSLLFEYKHKPLIHFDGHTECFKSITKVLGLLSRLTNTGQLQLLA